MKIALLGGSFNPPHICHTFIGCYVLSTTEIDQLWLVPCYRHAFGKRLESFEHRFAMCRQAIEPLKEPRVAVSSVERERRGTSWTIDTVRYLRRQYPEHQFLWVIGSDVLADLEKWRGIDELLTLIEFLVVPRAGSTHMLTSPRMNIRRDLIESTDFQLPDISSSLIRQRVQAGQPITHLVSRPVAGYIEKHQLYRRTS